MKSITITILFFLAIHQSVWSQVAQVFPTDSAYWEMGYKCYDGGPQNVYFITVTASFGNDTLIDNETYTTFINTASQGGTYPSFIRVVGEKVYYKRASLFMDTTTYEIFDFSLEPGDYFTIPAYLSQPYSLLVQAVDSVTYLDGITRKRIQFQDPFYNICGETSYWVEGIGGIPNPFYFDGNCFECMLASYSFYEHGQLVKDVLLKNNEIQHRTEILIYPNPAKSFVLIESKEVLIKEYTIFDLSGKQISQAKVDRHDVKLAIPPSMTKGMYLLTVKLENDVIQVEKLLVQ